MLSRLLRLVLLCLALAGAAPSALAQPLPVRIGYQTGDINVLLMYAANTRLFEAQQLAVTLVPFPAGPAMLPALAASEIDLAWMGEFPAVTGYSNGMPIEILMVERLDATNVRLAVNPAAGIQSLADLKGKRIAASVGSTSHNHLLHALKQAGLRQEDVTIVNLAPANMPPAYLAGQVDAALTWEPNIGIIEREGARTLATTRSLGMITGGIWVSRQAFTREQPETVQRFLKAWRLAQQAYEGAPREVRQYEAARVKQSADEFDALIARQTARHPGFEAQLTADVLGAPGQELDAGFVRHLRGIGDFLLAEKRIQALPADWRGLINTRPLQQFLAEPPR